MTTAPTPVTALLEGAINQYLSMDPGSRQRLAALKGGVVALHVSGVGVTLYFVPGEETLQVSGQFDGDPDAHIAGTPLALAGLLASEPTARMPESVTLVGDVELARHFNDLLRRVDLDWEELLSRFTGDLFAHRAGEAFREFESWLQRARESFRGDVAEYLQEETQTLPARAQVEAFMDGVDGLRSDADRLEARIQRLEQARDRARS